MRKENEILNDYLRQKGLKQTSQRNVILETFLASERHISADELHELIRKKNPRIGFSTVYRSLRLFTECGIAREVNFGDGRARFERGFDKNHHGHLVCTNCGRTEEFTTPVIQKTSKQVAEKYGYSLDGHRFEIYGLCKKCQ